MKLRTDGMIWFRDQDGLLKPIRFIRYGDLTYRFVKEGDKLILEREVKHCQTV